MKRILFIEDEQHLSRFVEMELRHEKNEVVLAYDGVTGLNLALAEDWDVILLDLMLPKWMVWKYVGRFVLLKIHQSLC